ncbi:scavenger receptor class B member 1-like [Bacillus rossius redtenbacheri]|uniref:scavenger receptor class B member 1-like n=1 Tax=Bacillus rossius redtenbacheri TaxID=93214 RepID=UPI002FDEC971
MTGEEGRAQASKDSRWTGFLVPVIILVLSSFATIILAKTDILKDIVLEKLAISNGSVFYDMWIRSPVEPLLKVHIFNYTNLEAVENGRDKKFKVEEIGPYTYREITEKVNVVFNNDGTVTYQENRSYVFVPEMSAGSEDDVVVSPKITMISAAALLPSMNLLMYFATSLVLHTSPTFLRQSAHDFLWVGDNELLTMGAKIMEGKPFGDFGIFSSRTGLSKHRITVNTGSLDVTKLGVVSRLDNRVSLGAWGNAECDRIDGSTGTLFPAAAVSPSSTLYVFNPDLCRRFPLTFQRHVQVPTIHTSSMLFLLDPDLCRRFPLTFQRHVQTRSGVQALRFEVPRDVFETPGRNPSNECFCRDEPAACRAGVFDISPCTLGAPIVLSFPHFSLGDPALREVVDGLQPDSSKHHTFVDVHESLGIPLAAKFRFQINVAIQKDTDMVLKEFQEGAIVPIIWFELGVAQLPDQLERLMYHVTFSLLRVQLLLCAAGAVAAAASAVCAVRRARELAAARRRSGAALLGSFSLRRPA